MNKFKWALAVLALTALTVPASAQTSWESWLNGYAMELGKVRANYTGIAAGVGCCADSKQKVDENWEKANELLAEALANSRQKETSFAMCSAMDLMGLRISLTGLRVRFLAQTSMEDANKGSTSSQTEAQLRRIAEDMKTMSKSLKAYQVKIGCRAG